VTLAVRLENATYQRVTAKQQLNLSTLATRSVLSISTVCLLENRDKGIVMNSAVCGWIKEG